VRMRKRKKKFKLNLKPHLFTMLIHFLFFSHEKYNSAHMAKEKKLKMLMLLNLEKDLLKRRKLRKN